MTPVEAQPQKERERERESKAERVETLGRRSSLHRITGKFREYREKRNEAVNET